MYQSHCVPVPLCASPSYCAQYSPIMPPPRPIVSQFHCVLVPVIVHSTVPLCPPSHCVPVPVCASHSYCVQYSHIMPPTLHRPTVSQFHCVLIPFIVFSPPLCPSSHCVPVPICLSPIQCVPVLVCVSPIHYAQSHCAPVPFTEFITSHCVQFPGCTSFIASRSQSALVAFCYIPRVYHSYCVPFLKCTSPNVSHLQSVPVPLCPIRRVYQSHCVPFPECTSPIVSHPQSVPVPMCPILRVQQSHCVPSLGLGSALRVRVTQ